EGGEVSAHVADLTEREQAVALVEAAGELDILVNSAGLAQTGVEMPFPHFADIDPQLMMRQLDTTFMTAFHTTKAVLPGLVARGYGPILMVSSVTGPFVTAPGSGAYAAAKGAMDGMMRTIAVEHGRDGITCTSVSPGWIATAASEPDETEAGKHTPAGRSGEPGGGAGAV